MKAKQGSLATAVWEFYIDFADIKHDNLSKVLKFAKRCHEKFLNNEFVDAKPSKKISLESGGGMKYKAPEVRKAILQWFINLREVLKGRLPIKVFWSKCQQV